MPVRTRHLKHSGVSAIIIYIGAVCTHYLASVTVNALSPCSELVTSVHGKGQLTSASRYFQSMESCFSWGGVRWIWGLEP